MLTSALILFGFLLVHFWGAVFMQTFFLHRYASHGMFRLSRGWERFFYFLTYLFQGSSYLVPSAYAWLHRAHHAYSDTDKDPHTPHLYTNVASMMWVTKDRYSDLVDRKVQPEERFRGYAPEWPALDRIGSSYIGRVAWGAAYTLVYIALAPHWAFFLLLPIHYFMGPIHGAIVNWAGHKYGYRNFDTRDQSRNVLPWDLVTLGELFQNNHHRHAQSANFAARAGEFDPSWVAIAAMNRLGVLDLTQRPQADEPQSQPAPAVG